MAELAPNLAHEDAVLPDEPLELGEYRPLYPKREAATILGAVSLIAIGTKILYSKVSERLTHER